MRRLLMLPLLLLLLGGAAPQKPYAECVADPEAYLALSFQEFDQGVRPVADGPRQEGGWREVARPPSGGLVA